MLHPANVNVDRHPRFLDICLNEGVLELLQEPEVVPGRVHERIECINFSFDVGAATAWASQICIRLEALHIRQRSSTLEKRCVVVVDRWQQDWQIRLSDRNPAALGAFDRGDWSAPVALAADEPVTHAVLADKVVGGVEALEFINDLCSRSRGWQPIELAAVDEKLLLRVVENLD